MKDMKKRLWAAICLFWIIIVLLQGCGADDAASVDNQADPSGDVSADGGEISPQEIELNKQQLDLTIGDSEQLEALVLPENAEVYELEWVSSDETVAAVDNTGLITGVAAGSAQVSVTIAGNSGLSAVCEVTVAESEFSGSVTAVPNGEMQELLRLVNDARASVGVSPLTWSDSLGTAAQIRAEELIVSFSHTRPDGSEWHTVSSLARGENIAYGNGSAQAVFDGWMGSDGHRANILNAGFTIMGSGCASGGGSYYWCQLFG